MILIDPSKIPEIDRFACDELGISVRELMLRAGEAVARAVRENVPTGSKVRIFAGKGNNGGDGYAAATLLKGCYDVIVYDVFAAGQRSDEGRYFLEKFISSGGRVVKLSDTMALRDDLHESHCVIDAIFGTGFVGSYPRITVELAQIFSSLKDAFKIAIDLPLGVNASDGSLDIGASYPADLTVALGFVKPGLVSYPAKENVGKLVYDNLGLQNEAVLSHFSADGYYIDRELASDLIPKRHDNSHKGTYGKLLMITGSPEFPGAAHLSLEAALRGGVGYVTYLGEPKLCDSLLPKLPEAIYKPFAVRSQVENPADIAVALSSSHTATLIGSGSSRCDAVRMAVEAMLKSPGTPVVLDADAINVLAEAPERGRELIRLSSRKLILTPHPLEFSRISGVPIAEIQQNRIALAKAFAKENNCVLVLKGAATIVTDGEGLYINSSGSSALAKAGSGDVLAGFLASLVASGLDGLRASALAVYLHGLAADTLSEQYSDFGVTPSDLPKEIARQLAICLKT